MAPEKASHTEQYMDYSGERENVPTLTVMVGPAGSGKSTHASSIVKWSAGTVVRLNRDALRAMMHCDSPWNHYKEDLVRKYEEEGIRLFLSMGIDVVVDDTNCVPRTRHRLEEVARGARVRFCLHTMNVDKDECKRRNALRTGRECVPEETIDQQFERLSEATVRPAGYGLDKANRALDDWNDLWDASQGRGEFRERLPGAPWVLCDVDGTLAENCGEHSIHDESKVLLDEPRMGVVKWVQGLYPTHNIAILSGRHDTCCNDTCDWMGMYGVPFDLILMRTATSCAADYIVKQGMLDALLKVIDKSRIAFVLDDRPQVVNKVWRNAGIKVYPVGGTTEHGDECAFQPDKKGWRHCPECGALEEF